MAELGFKDVIEQLKVNNRSEAGRDSTHTNEMRMSREANNQSFAELQEAITGARSAIADQSDNQPSASRLEEDEKNKASQTEKTNTLLQKIAGGFSGLKKSLTDGFKKVTGGSGKLGKFVRGTLLAALFFALAKFFNSPLYQDMIDYIFKTLIPKLQFFYDAFFGPEGGFINGMKALFDDESGIGSIVLGLMGVTAVLAGFGIVSIFKKLRSGTRTLFKFFQTCIRRSGASRWRYIKTKKGHWSW